MDEEQRLKERAATKAKLARAMMAIRAVLLCEDDAQAEVKANDAAEMLLTIAEEK